MRFSANRFRVVMIGVGLIASCAPSPRPASSAGPAAAGAPAPDAAPAERDLSRRVDEYWKARQRKDLSSMYGYYSGGYRSRHSREEFVRKIRLVRFDLLEFRIAGIERSQESATVTIEYKTLAPPKIAEPIPSRVTEKWVLDPDRQWYKERETILLPFPGKSGASEEVED